MTVFYAQGVGTKMVWKYFTKSRYLVVIAAVSSLLRSTLMFFIGVEKTLSAFVYYFYGHALRTRNAPPS